MRELVNILFGAVFTVAVSSALGFLLIDRLRLKFYRFEATLFAFLAGAAFLSFLVTLLSFVHEARRGYFLWGGLLAIAAAVWRNWGRERRRSLPAIPLDWLVPFYLLFGVFFIYYFVTAFAPEISPDGSGYHLGNVVRIWRNHGFVWNYHSMYSYFSQGVEMLFVFAFSFGRHSAAALVHFAFFCALPLLMVRSGCRFGWEKASLFAAAILFVSPVIAKDGVSAYIDLAVATLIYAVFYLLQVWSEEKYPNLLLLIGLLSGFCYAVKYTAFLALPFAAVVVWRRSSERRWRNLLWLVLPATAGRTLGTPKLVLGGQSIRPIPQCLVPERLLPRRDGTPLCRTARTVPRHQALLGDSATTHSTWRTCRWALWPCFSPRSALPPRVALEVWPPAAGRRPGFRRTSVPEYGRALPHPVRSVRRPGARVGARRNPRGAPDIGFVPGACLLAADPHHLVSPMDVAHQWIPHRSRSPGATGRRLYHPGDRRLRAPGPD